MPNLKVNIRDRILSVISYITAGWGGLIVWIIFYFAHIKLDKFLRFNILQSIFISFAYFIIYSIFGLCFYILAHIPLIQIVSTYLQFALFRPIVFSYSLIQILIVVLIAYCVVFSIMGRYPKIYKVSQWINNIAG